MAGISSYGVCVPFYRVHRGEIAEFWGKSVEPGERALANCDEDSITMAVEAAMDCLQGVDRRQVDRLYFASTTPPYQGKQCASIAAAALNLRPEVVTIDITDSLRSGTMGIKVALDAIKAKMARNVLVVASDCDTPAPDSEPELTFADGAVAFLLSDSGAAVEIEGDYAIFSEFMDIWRTEEDRFPQSWERRFILEKGYMHYLELAISGLLKKRGLMPKDFTKVVFYGPDSRSHAAMARRLGFDLKSQVQDPMFDSLGDTRAAFALMMLAAALEDTKPGDTILLANYGDGSDAYALRITDQVEKLKKTRTIRSLLDSKMLISYVKYLRLRKLVEREKQRFPEEGTSLTQLWREQEQVLRLIGHKCRRCGHIQFPKQRVCMWCQAKDDFEEIRLSDQKGVLFTFCMEERTVRVLDLPNVACEVDLEGGTRFHCLLTDRDPANIRINMPVELVFRKIHDGGGVHNYFWKARPARVE